jgi:hypothetical protein
VELEIGEITSLPEARGSSAKRASPEFSAEWKTRYEWDSGEYASVEALRRSLAAGGGMPDPSTSEVTPAVAKKDPDAPTPKRGVAPVKPPEKPPAAKPGPAAPAPSPKPAASAPPVPPPAKPAARPAAEVPTGPNPAAKPAALPRKIARIRLVGSEVDLTVSQPGTYELGRLSSATLRVVHPTVSRRQIRVALAPDRATARVQGLGAASPSLVNGRTLGEEWVNLADGDKLQVGEVVLSVRLES